MQQTLYSSSGVDATVQNSSAGEKHQAADKDGRCISVRDFTGGRSLRRQQGILAGTAVGALLLKTTRRRHRSEEVPTVPASIATYRRSSRA